MPFGNESTWDNLSGSLPQDAVGSPMPFGNESTWDGLDPSEGSWDGNKSPMPFGNESTWDNQTKPNHDMTTTVTNAFRQRVHLGRQPICRSSIRLRRRHQCLSATSPLGTPINMKALILLTQVTNAFRQRVHLGH